MDNSETKKANKRAIRIYDDNILITYDCKTGKFTYPVIAGEHFFANFDDRPMWEIMVDDKFASESTANRFKNKVAEIAAATSPQVFFTEYFLKKTYHRWKWYRVGFICTEPNSVISITFTDIDNEITGIPLQHPRNYDDLTGLLNQKAFCRNVEAIIQSDRDGALAGEYAVVCFDVLKFKAINDIFGVQEGNQLLKYIAGVLSQNVKKGDLCCRPGSDRFIFFTHSSGKELEAILETILKDISQFDVNFEIVCNMGIYVTKEIELSVESMIDRAVLAQSYIKGSYTVKYNFYTESLRNAMLTESEITSMMSSAIDDNNFIVYYQPQYNHSTRRLLGAEALVRWKHPERGLISPGAFIPIFEKNGFIINLDIYVYEQVCSFLKGCIDKNITCVPISTNFSRYSIFQNDFVEKIELIRNKYNVPVKYLRIELTESAVMGSAQRINEVARKLHEHGYVIEMDDFGCGYSSLNVLKDIELDIIKLDMMFLSENAGHNRGGTILSSVVRMAKWLKMPVIAEGVETVDQADFLKSIGCNYVQGYLYSKPLPGNEFEELLGDSVVGITSLQFRLIENMNSCDFWNPKSQETLIFSNYVGGAAIFDYHDGKIEILRVNNKYLQELGANISENELIETDPLTFLDENNRHTYISMLNRAIDSQEEEECETWYTIPALHSGFENVCLRTNVRMIGKSDGNFLFYSMIRNITVEKALYANMYDAERRLKVACEQNDIYSWEYIVNTKEMKPCCRCIRDLKLPSTLYNYPEGIVERGIIPEDYIETFLGWHRQVEEGTSSFDAVIPITDKRILFRIKSTTVFDEQGNPVKVYGSAVRVKDDKVS